MVSSSMVDKAYIEVAGSGEFINVDIYTPCGDSAQGGIRQPLRPVIIVVIGGGGKDTLTGAPLVGKYAAAYHDLATDLQLAGFFVLIPSRRGDPQRLPGALDSMAPLFSSRLPRNLFDDKGPNHGLHTHCRNVEEIKAVLSHIGELCGPTGDVTRIGLIGKSAGSGIALRAAAESDAHIRALALWGSALRTSQWFTGPKADSFFKDILEARNVRHVRDPFLAEICDAIDHVAQVRCPTLFACAAPDPYAPDPPEPDKWSDPLEQLQLQRYAVNCRDAQVAIIKGAEHTVFREIPAFNRYSGTLRRWFEEHLLEASNG